MENWKITIADGIKSVEAKTNGIVSVVCDDGFEPSVVKEAITSHARLFGLEHGVSFTMSVAGRFNVVASRGEEQAFVNKIKEVKQDVKYWRQFENAVTNAYNNLHTHEDKPSGDGSSVKISTYTYGSGKTEQPVSGAVSVQKNIPSWIIVLITAVVIWLLFAK